MLAELISERAASIDTYVLYSRVLFGQDKKKEALEAAKASVAAFSDDWQAAALLARTFLRLRRAPAAKALLADACRKFADSAPINALHAETLLVLADPDGALVFAEAAIANEADREHAAALKIVIIDALGRHKEAKALLAACPQALGKLPALYRDAIAGLAALRGKEFALALARSACEVVAGDVSLHLGYAGRLLAESRAQEALETLDQVSCPDDASDDLRARFFKTRARALQILKDRNGAIAAYETVLTVQPEDQDALRALYILHQQIGRTAEMRAYGQRLSKSGARAMPKTLSTGLDQTAVATPAAKIDQAKVAWAWELADREATSKEDWLARLRWGHNADRLMKAWWLNLPERSAEIDALIDRPISNPLEGLAAGARCVCVTTHMGPMAAGVRFLQTCGRPYRGFGYAGPDPVVGEAPPMRIAAKGNSGLKELIREIRNGTLIGFAPDSPATTDALSFDFCGRKIYLSTMVPRLIYKENTASFWWHGLWRDGRIVMELIRLPDPEEEEDIEIWCRRWAAAYLSHVERVMRGPPENLNCGAGIWRNADGISNAPAAEDD